MRWNYGTESGKERGTRCGYEGVWIHKSSKSRRVVMVVHPLQENALGALLLHDGRLQRGDNGLQKGYHQWSAGYVRDPPTGTHLVKDVLQPLLRERRALDVLDRPQLPSEFLSLVGINRSLLLPGQLLQLRAVVSQVDLGAHD